MCSTHGGTHTPRPAGGTHPTPSRTPSVAPCRGTPQPGRVPVTPVHPGLRHVPRGASEESDGAHCTCRAGGGSCVVRVGRAGKTQAQREQRGELSAVVSSGDKNRSQGENKANGTIALIEKKAQTSFHIDLRAGVVWI